MTTISTSAYQINPVMPITPIKPLTNDTKNKEEERRKKEKNPLDENPFEVIIQEEIEKLGE